MYEMKEFHARKRPPFPVEQVTTHNSKTKSPEILGDGPSFKFREHSILKYNGALQK